MNKFIAKGFSDWEISEEGKALISQLVTNINSNVYALTDKFPLLEGAACMARLSRSAGTLTEIYLKEFAERVGAGDKLMENVVDGYGDDSVQQLIHLRFQVDNASNLLTKYLEWGRFGAYLEQSTRYIFFDVKVRGKWRYHTPSNLQGNARKQYTRGIDTLFEQYSLVVRELTAFIRTKSPLIVKDGEDEQAKKVAWQNATRAQACDAARVLLPVSTRSNVGIVMSAQTVEQTYMRLMSMDNTEANKVAQQILDECRKVAPAFLRRADLPERGGAITAYLAATRKSVKEIVNDYGFARDPAEKAAMWDGKSVILKDFYPKNELDLAADVVWEFGDLPEDATDTQRQAIIRAGIGTRYNRRHRPNRAFENAHFWWEFIGDYGTFRDLQRHRVVDDLRWQQLTPYYIYEVPDIAIEAGLQMEYEKSFALSYELYEFILENSDTETAQYATLLGHRMPYRMTTNLRELYHLLELRTGPTGHPGYRKLGLDMYQQVKEVYPICAEGMRFINQGEDDELTRLSAEIAQQHKRVRDGIALKALEDED